MSQRSTLHNTFVIERWYDATPARVFKAFADKSVKSRWFVGPEGWQRGDYQLDFRVGGRERLSGGPPEGPIHTYECRYQDIVPNERIIYTYDMHENDQRISVSLATFEFKPDGVGTKLVLTEQGAYLDGFDQPQVRDSGTQQLLDNLEAELRGQVAAV